MIPQNNRPVNTPTKFDSLFDDDKQTINRERSASLLDDAASLVQRAERLAMTAAEMIRAAENRWQREYMLDIVHQGGNGRVECVTPVDDPASAPWVHLLPVGWRQNPSGSWMRTYLVRGTGANYGAPDWTESDNMREWLTDGREDTGGVMTEVLP